MSSKRFELKGGAKFEERLRQIAKMANKARLSVGFYENATYPKKKGQKNALHVAQVAYWHNTGTLENGGFLKPRPFFSRAIDDNNQKWFCGVGKRLAANGYNLREAFGRLGEQAVSDIKDKINHWPDDLEESTKKAKERKGGSNRGALKDTLNMRNSVGYQYDDEPPQYSKGGN